MNRMPLLDQIFSEEEECPMCPSDEGDLSFHEGIFLQPSQVDLFAFCKIQNSYLGIRGSRGDHFTSGIATRFMLDH